MKRLVTLLFTCLLIGTLTGQNLTEPRLGNPVQFSKDALRKTKSPYGWYNYGREIWNANQGTTQYFRNNLFPDSTVVAQFSNGYAPVWKHVCGQVLDPKTAWFTVGGNVPTLQPTDAYRVDSFAIYYRYNRPQTGAGDTLIFQFYKQAEMFVDTDGFNADGRSYAMPNWDYIPQLGVNAFETIKYVLEDNDSTMGTQGRIQVALSAAGNANVIQPGEICAASVIYKPGNPFNVGDTIDPYATDPVVNKINSFIAYDFRDDNKILDNGYYNQALTVPTDVRYNFSSNGWNGYFIPGVAWNAGFYHWDVEFHISQAQSTNELAKRNVKLDVFPNPAKLEGKLNIRLTANDPSQTELVLLDLAGRKVKDLGSRKVYGGTQTLTVNIRGVEPGIYLLGVITDQGTTSKQVVITN